MELNQFRILYRKFLFQMVDLDLLSPQTELSKLLGQFSSLLIFLSMLISIAAVLGGGPGLGKESLLPIWTFEHFSIATTMLAVGLFAVLGWNSTFLGQRDVLVLFPLPVRTRTLFFAKIAAIAASLTLVVVLINAFPSVAWTAAFARHPEVRSFPALTSDPAILPVGPSELKALMDADLAKLPPRAGIVIGAWKRGVRDVFSYGAAETDSIFEVGAISKSLTGLLLSQMVVQGKARLEEPVRQLLPAGVVADPRAREITLLDLATHRSGLPSVLPDNGTQNIYEFIGNRGVANPPDVPVRFSSLGFAVLTQALANRAGIPIADLARHSVIEPLGLRDTTLYVSATGDISVRSTARDVLTYLEANVHPERIGTLAAAIQESHLPRAEFGKAWVFSRSPELVALGWAYDVDSEAYWHDGAERNTSSMVFFSPKGDFAAVVLMRNGPDSGRIAQRIAQRLMGRSAISLTTITIPAIEGVAGTIRWFLAFWITMLLAGAFIFCCVLGLQGLASQFLPRRLFLQVSAPLQLAAFCVMVVGYFIQPMQTTEPALIAAQQDGLLAWSPSYWFLGLFQRLTGSPALEVLAHRAVVAMVVVGSATATAYVMSYFRTLRKIVEEPDIVFSSRNFPLPGFGKAPQTAIAHFSIRTFFRSRQHRVIFAFYMGVAFALTILLMQTPLVRQLSSVAQSDPWADRSVPLLASSVLMMGFCLMGMRAIVSMPFDLQANWVFQSTLIHNRKLYMSARRRIFLFVVALVWTAWTVLLISIWEWQHALGHLVVLGLVGLASTELCLLGTQKIPFTCSYLPGKSNFHMTFWAVVGTGVVFIVKGATFERQSLQDFTSFSAMVVVLGAVAVAARWRAEWSARECDPQFEDLPDPVVIRLDL